MDYEISQLIHFALEHNMIQEEDIDYSVNLLLDLLQLDDIHLQKINEPVKECVSILEKILNYAVSKNIIEDQITAKDLFDTRIMNCIMPRPSEVHKTFKEKYKMCGFIARFLFSFKCE